MAACGAAPRTPGAAKSPTCRRISGVAVAHNRLSPQAGAMKRFAIRAVAVWAAVAASITSAATLEVGPGRRFSRIDEANAAARAGDEIVVFPRADGRPYEREAIFVRQPRLVFRAATAERVAISGKGFDYSGEGSTPRAIFQFNEGTDDCLLEGFDLADAHNGSHNGAGVRINQANRIRIRNCTIHDNDMGIMSNGDGSLRRGLDQRIERCTIHGNGNPADPGQNHNLYLGGASVTLRFCEVHSSLTGHNVKSRAHATRVEYCSVHHSANREFDLVDAGETALPESHAVLLGNVIVKANDCPGNRAVIHFGQDGGREHDGTLFMAFNTVVTPFVSPVVDLSAAKAKARLVGNFVSDGGQRQAGQTAAAVRNGASLQEVTGEHNWWSGDFATGARGLGLGESNRFERLTGQVFAAAATGDYRLTADVARMLAIAPAHPLGLPAVPGMAAGDAIEPLARQYRHPAGESPRFDGPCRILGAHGPTGSGAERGLKDGR